MKSILFAILFTFVAVPVYAYELLMFSNPSCSYCQDFFRDVEPGYHSTQIAKQFPLRVINTVGPPPQWFSDAYDRNNIDSIDATPTFVMWDEKQQSEIARLVGYENKADFYKMLNQFMELFHNKLEERAIEDSVELPPLEKPHRGPMDQFGNSRLPPEGVINSRDLFKHMYKTPEEAVKASDWFGCHGTIHYHKDENVWMPCRME